MNTTQEYTQYIKPDWAPPSWIFGPVWSVLYLLIAIGYGKVFLMLYHKQIPFIVALPFILNLIFNFSFTYFQFKLQNNFLAAIDIILVIKYFKIIIDHFWLFAPDNQMLE